MMNLYRITYNVPAWNKPNAGVEVDYVDAFGVDKEDALISMHENGGYALFDLKGVVAIEKAPVNSHN